MKWSEINIELPKGEHQFKYIVDGCWTCDQNLPVVANALGSSNNYVLFDVDKIMFKCIKIMFKT